MVVVLEEVVTVCFKTVNILIGFRGNMFSKIFECDAEH